jgi:hypothetical protein
MLKIGSFVSQIRESISGTKEAGGFSCALDRVSVRRIDARTSLHWRSIDHAHAHCVDVLDHSGSLRYRSWLNTTTARVEAALIALRSESSVRLRPLTNATAVDPTTPASRSHSTGSSLAGSVESRMFNGAGSGDGSQFADAVDYSVSTAGSGDGSAAPMPRRNSRHASDGDTGNTVAVPNGRGTER